jgi:hypothetical protein
MAVERRQPALARAANAMMRALGGAAVKLRIPVASTGGTRRELGIAPPMYQEIELAPVIVRETTADKNVRPTETFVVQIEVLISSSALDNVMPGFGATDGRSFLNSVQQIVYGELVFAVTEVSEDRFAGVAYMYHVTAAR